MILLNAVLEKFDALKIPIIFRVRVFRFPSFIDIVSAISISMLC